MCSVLCVILEKMNRVFREDGGKNKLSLVRVLVWRHKDVFIGLNWVFRLIFRVLDVPKGLEAGPHQRGP